MLLTIDGFETLTRQQLFDMSASHIMAQGKPGITSTGNCSYSQGCAASIFIKPELIAEADIGGSWDDLEREEYVPETNSDFVNTLQLAHDRAALASLRDDSSDLGGFMADWSQRMRDIAKVYNLNTEALSG